jgi:hypothetical protein
MQNNLFSLLSNGGSSVSSNDSVFDQSLLQLDWRYQEISASIYHRSLTEALEQVWQYWSNKVSYASPSFSVLRKLPAIDNKSSDSEQNVISALKRGGSVIMVCPLLAESCDSSIISININWHNDTLKYKIRNSGYFNRSSQPEQFYTMSDLINAVLTRAQDSSSFSNRFEEILENPKILAI